MADTKYVFVDGLHIKTYKVHENKKGNSNHETKLLSRFSVKCHAVVIRQWSSIHLCSVPLILHRIMINLESIKLEIPISLQYSELGKETRGGVSRGNS